ncbi:FAD-dependent oxidoreductase [Puniceicoccus vermicola]|uniref:FAD-dependent oxidoreductase n=1 Tax=Puniceicoccus vermicola TaxID=388746 RepID=A0A7X1AZD9_9BACT|nr:FAD-dependent oxidoreductase [Puniceicoccus vermicola]MBC2602744.1 FAD-dependent oxidoreductase [Puniceicoccus vermicola]
MTNPSSLPSHAKALNDRIQQTICAEVAEITDVVVCGGGPAGIAAALSAARQGARTTLLEAQGCIGGVWTSGSLSLILDSDNKEGIMKEILENLRLCGGMGVTESGKRSNIYDAEKMKFLLEQMASDAGIHIRLHTRIVSAETNPDRRLTHVVTESKSGREAWRAKIFIDATGDGDLGAQAGCSFSMGRPENGQTQPMSLMAMLTGLPPQSVQKYCLGGTDSSPREKLKELLAKQGVTPSYGAPTLLHVNGQSFALMANHEYGYNSIRAEDLTRATLHARREINQIVDALRRSGPPWEKVHLVSTANHIGVREARRIRGRYRVSRDDLVEGRVHNNPICTATYWADVHSTDPNSGKTYGSEGTEVKPYQIPLEAAIAADVDGLMMAGRCISGDFIAHSSYRVTGNAVEMGENVGKIAALAAKTNRLPHEVILPGSESFDTKAS